MQNKPRFHVMTAKYTFFRWRWLRHFCRISSEEPLQSNEKACDYSNSTVFICSKLITKIFTTVIVVHDNRLDLIFVGSSVLAEKQTTAWAYLYLPLSQLIRIFRTRRSLLEF